MGFLVRFMTIMMIMIIIIMMMRCVHYATKPNILICARACEIFFSRDAVVAALTDVMRMSGFPWKSQHALVITEWSGFLLKFFCFR